MRAQIRLLRAVEAKLYTETKRFVNIVDRDGNLVTRQEPSCFTTNKESNEIALQIIRGGEYDR